MRLTQQTDFALRTLIYVAVNPDKLVKIMSIAETYRMSKSHLMKIVTVLVKGGFLIGVRGKGGGLKLAKQPKEIIIGQVVRHVEDLQVVECMSRNDYCIIKESCRMSGIFHHATEAFLHHLDQYTLADVIAKPADLSCLVEDEISA